MERKLFSHPSWILILTISLIISKRGKATLDIKPTDAVVLVNGSTFFNCSTFNSSNSSKDIVWYHYSVGKKERIDVFDDGEIRPNYKNRFRVETDWSKGIANLIIQDATLEDAGVYECQDGNGFGEEASAQLIVLEAVPTCKSNIHPDGVIGPNDCGIPPDQVQMSCSIMYRGNSPVHLEWRNQLENDNSSLIFECSNTTSYTSCNLTVTGDHIRSNSFYVCQTKNTRTNTFSCSSNAIRILYAMNNSTLISTTNEDEYICSANSSQQCSYTWENHDGTIVSTAKSLKPAKNGQYTCKANCALRGHTCLVIARNLNISIESTPAADETKTGETSTGAIIAGVLVSLFIIAAIVSAVLVLCRYKKWRQEHRDEPQKDKVKGNEDKSAAPAHLLDSIELQDAAVPKVQNKDVVGKAFNGNAFIGHGLSGEIYGPGIYKDNDCACEKIMFTADQLKAAKEGEITKDTMTLNKGRQWMKLDHDNLLKFFDVVLQSRAVFVITEYAAGGSVRSVLNNCEKDLVIELVKDWAIQIAEGMNYLHEKDIVYKSLKCAQILVMEKFDSSATARVTLKVCSYSLTHHETFDSTHPTFKGMFAWMAPEAISQSTHSKHSDIWSYGVTVWEILTREIPYKKTNDDEITVGIISGRVSLKIPEPCPLRNIFEECFDREPDKRPPFSKLLTLLKEQHT